MLHRESTMLTGWQHDSAELVWRVIFESSYCVDNCAYDREILKGR